MGYKRVHPGGPPLLTPGVEARCRVDYSGIDGAEAIRELRRLAIVILRQAVHNLHANARPELPGQIIVPIHTCTGHSAGCECRTCAWDFFSNHLGDPPRPCGFTWCCVVLRLEPQAVVEALRRRLSMEEP